MPFLISELVSNGAHRASALTRIITARPPDYFINCYKSRGMAVQVALSSNQQLRLCHLCGFALANFETSDGQIMETCSATGLVRLRKLTNHA